MSFLYAVEALAITAILLGFIVAILVTAQMLDRSERPTVWALERRDLPGVVSPSPARGPSGAGRALGTAMTVATSAGPGDVWIEVLPWDLVRPVPGACCVAEATEELMRVAEVDETSGDAVRLRVRFDRGLGGTFASFVPAGSRLDYIEMGGCADDAKGEGFPADGVGPGGS